MSQRDREVAERYWRFWKNVKIGTTLPALCQKCTNGFTDPPHKVVKIWDWGCYSLHGGVSKRYTLQCTICGGESQVDPIDFATPVKVQCRHCDKKDVYLATHVPEAELTEALMEGLMQGLGESEGKHKEKERQEEKAKTKTKTKTKTKEQQSQEKTG